MVTQPRASAMSPEMFMALPNDGHLHELVRGEVRVMPPPKGVHGRIETRLLAAIDRCLDDQAIALGWDASQGLAARDRLVGFAAGGEFGMQFTLPDDPHQIRGADGVYVPAAQYAAVEWDENEYFPAVPHLVIEVISPSERAGDVAEKVQDYLAGGAQRVWCVYPHQRAIHIHAPDAPTSVLRGNATLTEPDLLPSLSLPLNLIFS